MLKNIAFRSKAQPREIPKTKKTNLQTKLVPLIPRNRTEFWSSLCSVDSPHDLIESFQ